MSDSELRALEREALISGDPQIALSLYRTMLRQGKEPLKPRVISYEVEDLLATPVFIIVFNPEEGPILLQRKKLHVWVEASEPFPDESQRLPEVFEGSTRAGQREVMAPGVEFALIDHATNLQGQLIPLAILSKSDTARPVVSERKLQTYDAASREFFRKVREWGFQHPEAIEEAKLELLRFKLHLFHTKYQRELLALDETAAKLATSLIDLLRAGRL